ncbi:quinate permease 6 [Parachaetomium inaequale]|uniref:Quinate permease 6 n=1 Tax=Parachaetomium inaequale TaxID=2588326 RepID=A0AAN6SMT6_9PEZI|nr:quinate permease 6 [Parachaetomium inaequale]
MPSKELVYNWYVALVAAACMILMGYDASVFNSVQVSPNWKAHFDNPNAYMVGLINTTYTVGGIVTGWFASGPITDYLGRRWGMAIGCILTIIGTFIQTFTPWHQMGVFIFGRVLVGAGQALAITAGPIYIGEITESEIRGKVMSFWQMFYSVGSFIAYWINYGAARNRDTLGEWDWKMVVIFQLMMPLVILAQLPFIPESPRWLISRRKDVEAARQALTRVRHDPQTVEDELQTIREAIEYEREAQSEGWRAYLSLFRDASIRKRLYLAFFINVGQQLSGQGTLNSYSSTIYAKVYNDADTINLINALNATCGILFTLNAVWTVDRYGRRFLFLVGACGMALCTMIIPVIGLTTPGTTDKSKPVGIAITFMAFLFAFFYKPTWGATTWTYTSEIFPLNVRAPAVGMSVQMQGVANTIFQQFFPLFYQNEGLKTFFFFMATNICLATIAYFVLPETKQIALEEMDTLFGGVSHVEKGAAIIQEDTNVAETIGEEANNNRAVPMQDMARGDDKRV